MQISGENLTFSAGANIINQGDTSDFVYVLNQGQAAVVVSGVKVGEVVAGEMFGAMGVLTEMPRSASVIAISDCLVTEYTSAAFVSLIATRPEMVVRLIRDLSHAIVSLNAEFVKLRKDPLLEIVHRALV